MGAGEDLCRTKKTAATCVDQVKGRWKFEPFEGKAVKGLPRFTLTRGSVAIHDGEVRTQEGHGKFVSRPGNGVTNKALSTWKELTAPRPVERSGIPATGV